MEWEEALLTAWGGEIPPHIAAYYRRQAARARRVAEGATTKAEKARLLDAEGLGLVTPGPDVVGHGLDPGLDFGGRRLRFAASHLPTRRAWR